MVKSKVVFLIVTITMLVSTIIFSKMSFGATTQQSESFQIKHQLERQDAQLLKEKDAAGIKSKGIQPPVPSNAKLLTFTEPDEYKVPYQWKAEGYTQRHGLIKSANTVWTVRGIIEPNQEVWDEFVVWSGVSEDGKQVIGTFVDNGAVFNGKYDANYICPNQAIGKIYITNVLGNLIYFKSDEGVTGNFNLDSQNWNFDK